MSAISSSLNRRDFLASSAAVGAASLFPAAARAATEDGAIRPFRVNIPEEQLADLRRRITATRWPDKETVGDRSQGCLHGDRAGARVTECDACNQLTQITHVAWICALQQQLLHLEIQPSNRVPTCMS